MEQAESKIKLVVFGKNGQISSSLLRFLQLEKELLTVTYSSSDIDFKDLEKLENFLENKISKADFIINCTGYTNVDKAEDEKDLCDTLNHKAVSIIAAHCKKNHINLIHYSTDYVFDGSGNEAFKEDNKDNLSPINHYGKTKLLGEQAIIDSGCNYTIFRISWIYDLRPESKNFVNTIKRLAKEREILEIVDDQVGSPTSSDFVSSNTIRFIKKFHKKNSVNNRKLSSEIYHLNNGRFTSWYGFALEIIEDLKRDCKTLKIKEIKPIKTSEYKSKALRPLNSRLCNKKIQNFLGPDLY